jgi:hypothetical protein
LQYIPEFSVELKPPPQNKQTKTDYVGSAYMARIQIKISKAIGTILAKHG